MIAEIGTVSNGDAVRGLPIALPNSGNGWPFRPFQIVSLWDMIEVQPLLICVNLAFLADIQRVLADTTPSETDINDDTRNRLKECLSDTSDLFLNTLKLDEVKRHVDGLNFRLGGELKYERGASSYATIRHEVRFLSQEIRHAIKQRRFLCIPSDAVETYDKSALFGEVVALRFPEANKEISIAGTCYALESYTACVFHLTRAVEIVARVMVSRLGVTKELVNQSKKVIPVKLATWEQLRSALNAGLQRKQTGITTSERKRQVYEFYVHAVSQFGYFKDAWRNRVSHKRKTYQAGAAKDILENVKQFMLHVSERLNEPKGAKFD